MKTGQAKGAASIRKELKLAFPDTKFRVRSSGFSMGCSIDVKWVDGPSKVEVDEIIKKYQYGYYNGYEDIYEYKETKTEGSAKFVNGTRKYSDEVMLIAEAVISDNFSENCFDHFTTPSNKAWQYLQGVNLIGKVIIGFDFENDTFKFHEMGVKSAS